MYKYIPFYGWIILHCMDIPHFVHSSINGCWVVFTFRLLWIVLLWHIHVYAFVWICIFHSLRYILTNGSFWSNCNSNFMRNIVFNTFLYSSNIIIFYKGNIFLMATISYVSSKISSTLNIPDFIIICDYSYSWENCRMLRKCQSNEFNKRTF